MLGMYTQVISEQLPWLPTVVSTDLFYFPRPPHSLNCFYIVKLEELNQAGSQQGTLILNRSDILY